MEELIVEIYEIIKDYRQNEGKMSLDRIKNWINQFPESDRVFILSELKSIFDQRYFSKEIIVTGLEKIIIQVSAILGYTTPADFLRDSAFIDHQPDGKSQKEFIALVRDISLSKFGLNISNLTPSKPRYFIYIDDLLCTGDTLYKGLAKVEGEEKKGWLHQKINDQPHIEYILINKAKILILYFVIHKHNYSNFEWRLRTYLGFNFEPYYTPFAFNWIENDFKNINSKLEYLFPIKDNQPQNILNYSDSFKVQDDLGIYRIPSRPLSETFFSSKENRIRLENIILKQCMTLYELAGDNRSVRMRPLGYGLTSHKNLGFGTLCFTYRNVPFNTPLVFWYQSHNWIPLFERKFISYGHSNIDPEPQSPSDDYGEDV